MELLAPAGNTENFHVALEAGADAVYFGAPRLNARSLARDLSMAEIGAMIDYAHECDRRAYVAINSLVRETDLPDLLKVLVQIDAAAPDGLIVQDLGVARLVREFFPHLRMHASTLMTVHNRGSLDMYAHLGFSRIVAARELTLSEISAMTAADTVGIEIFVHGAMCFSYSGLCMFSSYFGGKSGLRGKCVQPCRRKFSTAPTGRNKPAPGRKKGGYLFSMNDLNGLEMVPELNRLGVASLKIEGRLRSATYVDNVVRAYRMIIDSPPDSLPQALVEGAELIEKGMGRKATSGFFLTPQPKDAITPHHSGNIGLHLGRIRTLRHHDGELLGSLTLKKPCGVGDRLRLHFEKSGERGAFSLAKMLLQDRPVEFGSGNETVEILLPKTIRVPKDPGVIEVYLVDVKHQPARGQRGRGTLKVRPSSGGNDKEINRRYNELKSVTAISSSGPSRADEAGGQGRKKGGYRQAEVWLRYDSPNLVFERLPFVPDKHVINLQHRAMSSIGKMKNHLKRGARSVIWALPPVVHDKQISQLRKNIRVLIKSGFRSFQVAHLSQIEFFVGEKVHLYGDYCLNLLNSQALNIAADLGLKGLQVCIEADRDSLKRAIDGFRKAGGQGVVPLGLTVYGSPALFTSRLAADHFMYGKPVVSPKNETFVIEKRGGYTQTRPAKPFSLLPHRRELEALGLDYLVLDLSGMKTGKKEMEELHKRLVAKEKLYRLPTFNYLGTLE